MGRTISLFLLLLATVSALQAQLWDRLSNPTVSVNLSHPPGLGLKVNKIAFGPASGQCADQIIESLISDFVSHQIEVVDRNHLQAILAEQNFSLSGYVDRTSAVAMGKILGPSALVFVRTQRCTTQTDRFYDRETRYNYRTKSSYEVTAYYSRTRAFLKASIQTVDLTTGRVFVARTLDYSPKQENKSYDGYPEAPSEYDVLDIAFREAVTEVHRMFLPWSEPTTLVYYNDNDCGLKQAFQLLKAGDINGAFHQSQQNLESCKGDSKVKPKVLGHAYYNLGMSHMMRNEHDDALRSFREAAKLRPGKIVTEAMADCQKAKGLVIAMQQIEERAALDAANEQAKVEEAVRADVAATLTNADVIEMVQGKLSDVIIIAKIKSSKHRFDTSSEALVALTGAGVSDKVVMAMMEP